MRLNDALTTINDVYIFGVVMPVFLYPAMTHKRIFMTYIAILMTYNRKIMTFV